MATRDIVVVGASAGGREALLELTRTLPADFPAAIFVVWHMPPTGVGLLPKILARETKLPAHNAVDQEPIQCGHIYVAPIDHHLMVEADRVRVTRGPKENRFRPAIDPLFRSAAYVFGPRVIGIILSGALSDGTSGLWAIKDRGGIAMVQDPEDAIVASMPASALENVDVDYRLRVSDMPPLLMRLTREPLELARPKPASDLMEVEVKIAKEKRTTEKEVQGFGQVSEFTCPECHGTLWQMNEGTLLRFRCRTGHAYTAEALLEDMAQSIEAMEWAAVRGMQESAVLMEQMANHFVQHGEQETAHRFLEQAAQARERSEVVRLAIHNDPLEQTEPGAGTAPV